MYLHKLHRTHHRIHPHTKLKICPLKKKSLCVLALPCEKVQVFYEGRESAAILLGTQLLGNHQLPPPIPYTHNHAGIRVGRVAHLVRVICGVPPSSSFSPTVSSPPSSPKCTSAQTHGSICHVLHGTQSTYLIHVAKVTSEQLEVEGRRGEERGERKKEVKVR